MPVLLGLSREQLATVMAEFGQPAYRAAQLTQAMYRDRIAHLSEVSTLPTALRAQMISAGYEIGMPELAETFRSVDGTERYLVRMADGETVETVWMPQGDGGEAGDGSRAADDAAQPSRRVASTLCISSQAGCAVNCSFCFTAKLGIRRNLTAGEIAGQVLAALSRHNVLLGAQAGSEDAARINIVFMGMGEPFLNYDAFMQAARLLHDEAGIPMSRMTVSTSGILPGILRFAAEERRPKLAISLNAPNDIAREAVMPINRKWNIAALLDAVSQVPLGPRERVTFEYVLLDGVNDRPEDARELAVLLLATNLPLKVNLIAWNGGPGIVYETPDEAAVAEFKRLLSAADVPTYIRKPRGRDIYAACGQLKRTGEAETPLVTLAPA